LASVRPDDLLAGVIQAVVKRSPFDPGAIEDVMVGCANQAGEDSRCIARHAGLLAGLPIEVAGTVLQRNCGSGLGAIVSAAHALTAGEGQVIVAGGVESMSRAPFVVGKSEAPYSKQFNVFDSALGARFPNPKVEAQFGGDTMVQTADNVAREHQITREQCDIFAAASQQKYAAAKADRFFAAEIAPVDVPSGRKGEVRSVAEDEHPRAGVTPESLARLKSLEPEGVTTAGNASGINDGAVALIVGTAEAGRAAGAKPLARIVASAVAGVPPRIMGLGPVAAGAKALQRAGLDLKDMDVIEINEAFAAQVLGCLSGLGIAYDDSRVNPNGGAISLGHPLGASGPRLLLTTIRQLHRTKTRYALVSLCIGLGQGVAAVVERVD
jgi:acetyl-CoA C-acetyltransferase